MGNDGEEALVFASKRMLAHVTKEDVIGADATFRICPRLAGATQVLIIAHFAFGKVSNRYLTITNSA